MYEYPCLIPSWNAPKHIQACTTTRHGGYSLPPYDSNNLGLHVEDRLEHVQSNRKKLIQSLQLPAEPLWLNQTHSNECLWLKEPLTPFSSPPSVDAVYTQCKSIPLIILTADCVPILICDQQGTEIAAIHAGWKGLLNGIIKNTLQYFQSKTLLAWIGPSICQRCYETSAEIKANFIHCYPKTIHAFQDNHADLAEIAVQQLKEAGVHSITQSKVCTYEEKNQYYSYRQAKQTGRIGTLIWFTSSFY